MTQRPPLASRMPPLALLPLLTALLGTLPLAGHAAPPEAPLQRGAYLVNAFGCVDCHTPHRPGPKGPEPDLSRGLSGHPHGLRMPPAPQARGPWLWGGSGVNTAFWGPWGVSYASNLTPDPATGLGNWTPQNFVDALRTGQHAGSGRPILPPMPWHAIGQLNEADLLAVFSHLMAQPPVANAVPAPQPPPRRR
jgi:hypothetical protein